MLPSTLISRPKKANLEMEKVVRFQLLWDVVRQPGTIAPICPVQLLQDKTTANTPYANAVPISAASDLTFCYSFV
eukprot:TCALIF_01497-PA protein Name:"Protein of unknown function" AED:0.15 eAED:0.15 QI:265/0.42/0.75/1/0.57/0.5/8/705/74